MTAADVSLADQKAELRTRMRARRAALPPADRAAFSASATDRLLLLREVGAARTAFVFHSFGSEISTGALIEALAQRGRALALPVLAGGVLQAAAYRLGDPLAPSSYGAEEPARHEFVDPADLDLIVAPGLAFDPQGWRLGYGGAYYDGFLRRTRPDAARVGFGFDFQVTEAVPHGPRDERLHAVVTEVRTLRVGAR